MKKKVIRAAVDIYRTFRGAEPKRLQVANLDIPEAVAVIGHLDYVGYRTTYEGESELYEHEFQPGSRPLLCVSHDGKQLVLLGGRYVFDKHHGIVDKDARGRKVLDPHHGQDIGFMRRRQANPMKKNPGADGKLRQKEVYEAIRQMGLTVKKTEHGEHRVTFTGVSAAKAEAAAHYTDDLADALGTAKHMAALRDKVMAAETARPARKLPANNVYRGYKIRKGTDGVWYITKDATYIGRGDTAEDCMDAVDSLLD